MGNPENNNFRKGLPDIIGRTKVESISKKEILMGVGIIMVAGGIYLFRGKIVETLASRNPFKLRWPLGEKASNIKPSTDSLDKPL